VDIEADSSSAISTTGVQASRTDRLSRRPDRFSTPPRRRGLASTPIAAPGAAIDWSGVVTQHVPCERGQIVFAQGDPAPTVMYVEEGAVRMSVLSPNGKEAVVAMLQSGHFFGEACLAGQSTRMATAKTIRRSTLRAIPRDEMIRHLHLKSAFLDCFIAHLVKRNIRIEQDLVDQLFNSSEKRLARALLLLGRSGDDADARDCVIPKITQELLAEMVGTTRPRINLFMNKFRRLGFVEYKSSGSMKINSALLHVVLRDG
jgi:CRP/FNR family transcriptional regulator, cyclic AMP receptor protein